MSCGRFHIAPLWSAGIGPIAFYRHIAPLERGIESIGFNSKPMDFQNLATWFTLSVIIYRTLTLEKRVMYLFFADGCGGTVSGKEFCIVGE